MNTLHLLAKAFIDTPEVSDYAALKTLAKCDKLWGVTEGCHEATEQRRSFIASIEQFAEGGMVAIYSSGMDCDCSRWENRRERVVPANVRDVEAALDDIYSGAEGPMSLWLDRPSARPPESHRDLALEAFEDGHPHVVFY